MVRTMRGDTHLSGRAGSFGPAAGDLAKVL